MSEQGPAEFPETLEELYDAAPVGYLTVRPDGAIVRANRTLLLWTGYSLADLVDKSWSQMLLTTAGHLFAETNIKPMVHVQGYAHGLAIDLRTTSGERRPVIVNIVKHTDRDGDALFWRLNFIEAADRRIYDTQLLDAKRRAEDTAEALRELTAELEERVERRTAELSLAVRELDSFAQAVSHDLRAPLRTVNGFTQLLRADYTHLLDDKGHHLLEQIETGCQTMSAIIDALLQLSVVSQGTLKTRPVDLTDHARAVWAEVSASDPARTVDFAVADGLVAMADPQLLDIVLRNLLGNAWKYTLKTAHPCVRVYATRDASGTFFHVEDNGAGFDMRFADQLFKPFRRLHERREFPGIGIGLATVRRIVERHGGTLSAAGSPGTGARFSFSLGCASHRAVHPQRTHPRAS